MRCVTAFSLFSQFLPYMAIYLCRQLSGDDSNHCIFNSSSLCRNPSRIFGCHNILSISNLLFQAAVLVNLTEFHHFYPPPSVILSLKVCLKGLQWILEMFRSVAMWLSFSYRFLLHLFFFFSLVFVIFFFKNFFFIKMLIVRRQSW